MAHSREVCRPVMGVEWAREYTLAVAPRASGEHRMAAWENWVAVAMMAVEAWNPCVRPASSSHTFLTSSHTFLIRGPKRESRERKRPVGGLMG